MNRRKACGILSAAVLYAGAAPVSAQSYPNRPIRIIHGFGPGGGADIVARLIGGELYKSLGQPVVVEPKPGAGSTLAAAAVARAAPDGHTLYIAMSTHAISAALQKSLPYDPVDDFEMISIVYDSPMLITVSADSPYQTLGALIEAARREPTGISYASAGVGAATHLIGETLAKSAKVSLLHVPYNGEVQCVLAVARGDVSSAIISPVAGVEQAKAGRLRILAVTTAVRWSGLPDVPTVSESGVPNFEVRSWLGLAAPAQTPKPIVAQLNSEVRKMLKDATVRGQLERMGAIIKGSSSEEMRERVASDLQRWRQLIAEAKIQP